MSTAFVGLLIIFPQTNDLEVLNRAKIDEFETQHPASHVLRPKSLRFTKGPTRVIKEQIVPAADPSLLQSKDEAKPAPQTPVAEASPNKTPEKVSASSLKQNSSSLRGMSQHDTLVVAPAVSNPASDSGNLLSGPLKVAELLTSPIKRRLSYTSASSQYDALINVDTDWV